MAYWGEYVSAGQRKAAATKHLKAAQKKGKTFHPIVTVRLLARFGEKLGATTWNGTPSMRTA